MAGRSMCILNVKKVRCREIEWFVQGCPVSDGQSEALTQVSDLKVSAACTAKRRGKSQRKGGWWGAGQHPAQILDGPPAGQP